MKFKNEIFSSLSCFLFERQFSLKKSRDTFERRQDGVVHNFQLVCLDGKPGCRVQPNVGVRFDVVEEIFHKTSGWDLKHQKYTPTIGAGIGNILSGDNRACEFVVNSIFDVNETAGNIVDIFDSFAIPYFDRFNSLSAIDGELNNKPTERTPNRPVPWLRCSTGIIVAKLVGRPNYEELATIYADVMARVDKGAYLGKFKALLLSLNGVKPLDEA